MIDVTDIQADINSCQGQIKRLQHSTIACVAFAPSGKVTVTDKPKLESANNEIDRLNELLASNTDVLGRLKGIIGENTIKSLHGRKYQLNESILRFKDGLRIDIGNILRFEHGVDPVTVLDHPKAKKTKAEADIKIDGLQKQLTEVQDMLTRAEVVLKDFQPSGLPEIKQPQAVGVARFDMPAKAPF